MTTRRIRNRRFIIISLLAFSIGSIILPNFITNDHFHLLNMYMYRVNEFLLHYYHKPVFEIPLDDVDYNFSSFRPRDPENVNFLCIIPEIKYDNVLAMKYLNIDFNKLNKTFYQCDDLKKELNLVSIQDYTLFDAESKILDKSLFEALKEQELVNEVPNDYKYIEYYSLKLDVKEFKEKLGQNIDDINCYTQRFDKLINESENKETILMLGDKYVFRKKFNFTVYIDTYGFYYVCCYKTNVVGTFKSYEYVFSIYPRNMSQLIKDRKKYIKFEDEKRRHFKEEPEKIEFDENDEMFKIDKKMNVLILGYDSLSLNHFKRVFPVTYNYLANKLENAVIYDSVSSVGANTFPNILALMSGLVESSVDGANVSSERSAIEDIDGTFWDLVPFIWREYEKLGYVTAYQEDQPSWAIFNYLKDGFRYKPTALYGRPYWLKYYKIRTGGPYTMCHQSKPTYKTYYEFIETFLSQMYRKQNINTPFFSFNFLSEYTHDFLASPPQLDNFTANILMNFETKGYFDNTLLIITSDHGNRLQSFAYGTEIGKIEKFLPFFSIRLPRKLWNTTLEKNLKLNKNKLIGFYDIYQTLRQFLHLNTQFSKPLKRSQYSLNSKHIRYSRGISLFEKIPMNRSCSDTLIPEEQCRCFKQYMINEAVFLKETKRSFDDVVTLILNKVIKITENYRDRCVVYKKDKIQSVKLLNIYQIIMYKFVVIFQPGDAWFEASVRTNKDRTLTLHGNINRISAYGNQSICVDTSFIRNYCYCKS